MLLFPRTAPRIEESGSEWGQHVSRGARCPEIHKTLSREESNAGRSSGNHGGTSGVSAVFATSAQSRHIEVDVGQAFETFRGFFCWLFLRSHPRHVVPGHRALDAGGSVRLHRLNKPI